MLEPIWPRGTRPWTARAGLIMLDALEAEEGTVLQAAFLGPWHGLGSGIDPAALAGKTPSPRCPGTGCRRGRRRAAFGRVPQ